MDEFCGKKSDNVSYISADSGGPFRLMLPVDEYKWARFWVKFVTENNSLIDKNQAFLIQEEISSIVGDSSLEILPWSTETLAIAPTFLQSLIKS